MADGFELDASGLTRLSVGLSSIPDNIMPGVTRAVGVSALKVKKRWRASLNGSAVPAAGSTVQYTVESGGDSASATIVADRGTERLRGYVHAREYGSPTVAPAGDARAALQATVADLVRGLSLAGQRAIERAARE